MSWSLLLFNFHTLYSPGVAFESQSISNLSISEYNNYLMSSYNNDFQALLIKIAREYSIVNSSDFGLDLTQIKNLLSCYLSIMNNNTFSFQTLTSYETNEDPYYFARDYITQGYPVLLRLGDETSSNGHTVIAYDYNEDNEDFFIHTGWKKNNTALSHIPLSELFNIGLYNTIYDATVLFPISTHYHTNNFYTGSTTHCPCKFMYIANNISIDTTSNYIDKLPIFTWDSTYKERWMSQSDFNYKIDVKIEENGADNVISTYYTDNNNFIIDRPADWKKITDNYENYKLDITYNYLGNNDFYNSILRTKTFNSPTLFINNPYLRSNNFSSLTSGFNVGKNATYTINNNTINANYYKVMYNTNDGQLMMSTVGQNTNFSYLHFNFDTEITRLDIDLAIYEDSQLDLTKGNYRIRAYWINEENVIEYLLSLVEDSESCRIKELSIGIENKETITAYFDFPIDNLMIRYEYLGSNPSSLCKIGVGDISFYKGQLPSATNPLPLSGYELEYDQDFWNTTKVGEDSKGDILLHHTTNCYSYAINMYINPFTKKYFEATTKLMPGQNKENFSIEELYSNTSLIMNIMYDSIEYGFTFIPVSKYETCPIGTYKIALVLDNYNYSGDIDDPDCDFHFYRQNSDGSWSHKLGNSRVYSNDQVRGSMKKIYDPKTCAKNFSEYLNYNVFVGFFAVSPVN